MARLKIFQRFSLTPLLNYRQVKDSRKNAHVKENQMMVLWLYGRDTAATYV